MLLIVLNAQAESTETTHSTLQGTVINNKNEAIAGVTVYFPELKTGAVTDINGKYKIDELPSKTLLIQVSSLGYKVIVENVVLSKKTQKDFVLEETIIEINEIAVTGQSGATQLAKMSAPVTLVSKKELQQKASTHLIDAISSQPGISQITTGSGISKPIIRGLGYNRIVVMNDGIRQEGQQWGDEHGIEMDEFNIDRVEILKGPASLMYGSDAMAGVVNFLTAPVLSQGVKVLNVLGNYQTNNGLRAYSVNFSGHEKSFVWDLRYSNKAAHAYQNKFDGYVYNSGFAENAVSALLGINKWWGYSHLTLSTYHLTPGIVEGDRDSASGQFIKAIFENGIEREAIAEKADFMLYQHQMPYQQVKHYKAVLNNNVLIGNGFLKSTIGFQQNRRQEFEDIVHPDDYALYFRLNTFNYSLYYHLSEHKGTDISLGLNGMAQQSANMGIEFLIPAYQLFDIGAFAMFRKSWKKLDIDGGLRYDNRTQNIDALYLDESGNKTDASTPDAIEKFSDFSGRFEGFSGSAGISYRPNDHRAFKFQLSRGFRSPNISELSSNGIHEGTQRYETGNLRLKPEASWQVDVEADFNSRHVSLKVNLFSNTINNFIYSHKLNTIQGADSVSEGAAVFKYTQGKAQLNGGELTLDFHPHPLDGLHFENSLSLVNAKLFNATDSTRYLPFIPAPKWTSDLRAEIQMPGNLLKNSYVSVGVEHYFKQNHVFSAYNTETVTPAYTLFNASLGTDIMLKKQRVSIYLNAINLTDLAYQSHLSRLKYTATNQLTRRSGVYNMGRNLSLKVMLPIEL